MIWVNIFKPNEVRDTWLVYAVIAAEPGPADRRRRDIDRYIRRREFPNGDQMAAEEYASRLLRELGQNGVIIRG